MDDLEERLRRVVVEQLGVKPEDVTDEASFADDLGVDDLDSIELVMTFEEELGVEIPPGKAEPIETFGDAVRMFTAVRSR